jgi:hypothetical protein
MSFALWLLSMALGFAVPAVSSVVDQEVPSVLGWHQPQLGNHDYDADSQSCLVYDAELSSVPTKALRGLVGIVPRIRAYDTCPVSTIAVVCPPRVLPAEKAELLAAGSATTIPEGSFSIIDRSGYPANLPKPTGPFRLLEGAEYDAARAAANQANLAMHQADPALRGLQIHEIQPVRHLDAHMPGGYRYNPGGPGSALPVYPVPAPIRPPMPGG